MTSAPHRFTKSATALLMPARKISLRPSIVLLAIPIFTCCHENDRTSTDANLLTGGDIRQAEKVAHELGGTRRWESVADVDSHHRRWMPEQWPDGEVPFSIEEDKRGMRGGGMGKGTGQISDDNFFGPFAEAIEDVHMHTCVAFRPKKPTDKFWIVITTGGRGCWSYVGLQKKLASEGQELSLPPECWSKGVILHELMHILGFYHEHTRWDRDEFIELNVANIQKDRLHQFDKRKKEDADSAGPYDVESITHYEARAFALDKRWPTIVAMDSRMYEAIESHRSTALEIEKYHPQLRKERSLSGTMNMGQRARLSIWDIEKINRLYNCIHNASTPQHHRHKHSHHRDGHHHTQASLPLPSKRGRAPRERNAAFLNIVTSNLAGQEEGAGMGWDANGSGGLPTEFWSPLQEGSLSMAQRQTDLGNLPTGVMDLFIAPDASRNEQRAPEQPPATYKNTEDFFIRTGLKPAGPSTYAYQLADGSYAMTFSEEVPPFMQRDQQQLWREGSNYHQDFENFPQFQPESIHPSPPPTCDTPAESNCVDRKEDCAELALKGECDRRPGMMLRMCRRSCCNCDDSKCYDTKDEPKYGTLCLAQTKLGNSIVLSACDIPETRQNALDYCPKACGTCVVAPTATPLRD